MFLAPGTSGDPQGVLRIVNDTGEAATVQVFAIADDGTRAGPATIALGASAAVQFDATELQSPNAARGLSGGLGSVVAHIIWSARPGLFSHSLVADFPGMSE